SSLDPDSHQEGAFMLSRRGSLAVALCAGGAIALFAGQSLAQPGRFDKMSLEQELQQLKAKINALEARLAVGEKAPPRKEKGKFEPKYEGKGPPGFDKKGPPKFDKKGPPDFERKKGPPDKKGFDRKGPPKTERGGPPFGKGPDGKGPPGWMKKGPREFD